MERYEIKALFWGESASSNLAGQMRKKGYVLMFCADLTFLAKMADFDTLIITARDLSVLFSKTGQPVSRLESKAIIVLGSVEPQNSQPLLQLSYVKQLHESATLKKVIRTLSEIKLKRESSRIIEFATSHSILEIIRPLVKQPDFNLKLFLNEIEKFLIIESLIAAKSDREKAAKILGISYRKMRYKTAIHQLPKSPPSRLRTSLNYVKTSNPPRTPPLQLVQLICEKGHEFKATRSQAEPITECPYCCVEWDLTKKSA